MSLRLSSTGSCSTSEALLAIRLSFMVAGRISVPKFRERGSAQSNEVLDGARGDPSVHPCRSSPTFGRSSRHVESIYFPFKTLLDALHRGEDKKKMKKMQNKGGSHRNGREEKELASERTSGGIKIWQRVVN
ncbi:hypothetical protein FB451DRAFT_1170706 [Mycena latifolia]|nr:hypothetical protein FB451DRAFT_1170706 [Mycena latifolia]